MGAHSEVVRRGDRMARSAPGSSWGRAGLRLGLIAVAGVVLGTACVAEPTPPPPRVGAARLVQSPLTPAPNVSGDAENGRRLFTELSVYPCGCAGCHTMLGVP